MHNAESKYKAQMISVGKRLVSSGLVSGTGGNLSIKTDKGILVTTTASQLDELVEDSIVLVNLDIAGTMQNEQRPTSEVFVHLACYRKKPSLKAIVHCHPVWTIGVVSGNKCIPPMFPEFVDDVGSLGYVDFVLPTSQEMVHAVSESIKTNNACIIRNHGVFSGGDNIIQAFYRAIIIEDTAKAFAIAKMIGPPQYLTEEQVNQVENLEATRYRRHLHKNL